jgi:ureidoacrylate peracid hydrolase
MQRAIIEPTSVEARPSAFPIDPARTAVIVVDMQNDFGSPGGSFDTAGVDISDIRAVVPPTRRVLEAARRNGIAVVYLKMAFKPDLSDAGAPDTPNWIKHLGLRAGAKSSAPDGSPSHFLIRDCWNTDILQELTPKPGDLVLYKHRYSGFFQTALDETLRNRSIDTLVFTGCTTSVCVESTFRDAMFRDYRCLLLEDCTAEPIGAGLARGNHEASLMVLEILFGWIATSASFLAAVNSPTNVTV